MRLPHNGDTFKVLSLPPTTPVFGMEVQKMTKFPYMSKSILDYPKLTACAKGEIVMGYPVYCTFFSFLGGIRNKYTTLYSNLIIFYLNNYSYSLLIQCLHCPTKPKKGYLHFHNFLFLKIFLQLYILHVEQIFRG